MAEVKKVAVFPCGSEVGLEIARALKHSAHFEVQGWSSVSDYGSIEFDNYHDGVPFYDSPEFLGYIAKCVRDFEIDYLIPAMDDVGYVLAAAEQGIDCEIVYPSAEVAEILRRKSSMYKALGSVVRTPRVFQASTVTEDALPLFAKPDIGYGSRGARPITTMAELGQHPDKELIITEFLPGNEYTVDCFSDKDGKVLFAGSRMRNRVRMGISTSTKTVKIPELESWAGKISEALGMSGAWFFQVKENSDGEPVLLEVAGRIAGSMALYRGLGINFILLDLFQRSGETVDVTMPNIESVRLERALTTKLVADLKYTDVYVDYDDCLIIRNSVNVDVVAFLFKSIRDGKSVHLITRHSGDLQQSISSFRLEGLFDSVIHLTDPNQSKSDHINAESSIFIDDSHAERTEVARALDIPVFAPDAVNMLI